MLSEEEAFKLAIGAFAVGWRKGWEASAEGYNYEYPFTPDDMPEEFEFDLEQFKKEIGL